MVESKASSCSKARNKKGAFCDQVVNSSVVAGIAGISAYAASDENIAFKVAGLAFSLTFLYKLKEYRKIA